MWLASESRDPKIRLVGVPSSKASLSPSRADLTPGAVRERFGRFSTFDGETGTDFGSVAVYDEGNWAVSELDMHVMPTAVESLARSLPDTALTLFVGGDNAITRPLVRCFGPDLARVGVITLDAHHDVRTLQLGPANGTPIRGLIEEDGLPGHNIHQIGIHTFANSSQYRDYCDAQGIRISTLANVERIGISTCMGGALSDLDQRCDVIYVDVDLDVLDSAFAPACPGGRPGGMRPRQLIEAVRIAGAHPKVRAIDFVEVDAGADHDGRTLDVLAQTVLAAASGFATRT